VGQQCFIDQQNSPQPFKALNTPTKEQSAQNVSPIANGVLLEDG